MALTPLPPEGPTGKAAQVPASGDNWTHLTRAAFEAAATPSSHFTVDQIEHLKRWMKEGLRSRMEIKPDYLVAMFFVPVVDGPADTVWMRKISILATHQSVLTVDDTPEGRSPLDFDTVVKRFRSYPNRSPGMLVYVVIDEIAWAFINLAEGFDAEVNEIEDALDDSHPHRASDGEWFRKRLQRFRSDVHDVRSALIPTEEAVDFIVGGEDLAGRELFPRDIKDRQRDTHDRLRYVSESLNVVRDEIGGLRDYLQARIGNEQNEIMKVLTIVAALVLVPTFVVGFFGQNFEELPGVRGNLAPWAVSVVMLSIVLAELWYLWHRGWIGRGPRRRFRR